MNQFIQFCVKYLDSKSSKMGKRNAPGGNKPKKERKTEIVFDENKRCDFLTGFRKRKDERRKKAKEEFEKKLKDEIKTAK